MKAACARTCWLALSLLATAAWAQSAPAAAGADTAILDALPGMRMTGVKGMDEMEGMSAHMRLSEPMPAAPGDAARAAEIVSTLQRVLPAYRDYHAAVAAGFQPFAVTMEELETQEPPAQGPNARGEIVHFTLSAWALEAQFGFDAAHPTSLLYRRMGKDKLELAGAMYTAPARSTPGMLNQRVPLSVARWHEHIDLCIPPRNQFAHADWSRFGPDGSIVTRAACDSAGGTFYPLLFGWMVHVYPFAATPAAIWAH